MGKRNRNQIKNQNKNKKKKTKSKDKNMAWWGKNNSFTNKWNKTKPTVVKSSDTLSVMLYKQSTLNEIAAICKPKALASEFQVHCRGAQILIQKPESDKRVVFTIPTYYFNMPQKVSSGSVDFNLDEVSAISEQIAPLSVKMVEKIGAQFPIKYFQDLGFEVGIRELEMGSLHRHPGDFGFSGTDLDNQVEKPGVIFRNLKCEDKIQVDSVMYIPQKHVKIVTTETRIVSVQPTEDEEGIEGTYTEAPTLCYIIEDTKHEPEGFGEFFGMKKKKKKTAFDFKIDQKWIKEEYPEIEGILGSFLDGMDYDPQLIVDPELIEQEYTHTKPSTYNRGTGYHAGGNYYGGVDAWDDDDDDDAFGTVTHVPATTTKVTVRPTWRKTQALGLLRAKGVDVNNNSKINGTASDSDVIAIVAALKKLKFEDKDIRSFFATCDYPVTAMGTYYTATSGTAGV